MECRRRTDKLRVCRVLAAFPTDRCPGGGLPAYYMSVFSDFETLHVSRRVRGATYAALPERVRLQTVSYPEVALGQKHGAQLVLAVVGKAIGEAVFTLRAFPRVFRFRPDIIHVHTLFGLSLALGLTRVRPTSVVVSLHGSDYLRVRKSAVLVRALRSVDAVCVVSEHMHDELEAMLGGTLVRFTPNGVDDRVFNLGSEVHRDVDVLMVGAFKWQKGYEFAVDAFARVVQSRGRLKVRLIGEGADRNKVERMVAANGLADHVEFLGMVDRAAVASEMRRARMLVLSSLSEGMPKVVLEALACGTPVIATDVGACRDLLSRGGGVVVKPGSNEALAEAILGFLDDAKAWAEMHRYAIQTATHFSWHHSVECIATIYEETLAARSG